MLTVIILQAFTGRAVCIVVIYLFYSLVCLEVGGAPIRKHKIRMTKIVLCAREGRNEEEAAAH